MLSVHSKRAAAAAAVQPLQKQADDARTQLETLRKQVEQLQTRLKPQDKAA